MPGFLTMPLDWRKFRTLFAVHYAEMVEYRAELYLWALSGLFPFILMGVWMQAAKSGQFGLSSVDFARYFLAVFLIRNLTTVWVIWEFEFTVVEGTLSHTLLQPINPGWHHLLAHLAERAARFPFMLILVGIFFALYPRAFFVPPLGRFLQAVLVIVLAFLLRFVMQYAFAMLAFWYEKAAAIEQVWFLPFLFLSGLIGPLEVFPPRLRAIIEWTPFPYVVYYPAKLLLGQAVNMPRLLAVMSLWTAVFFGLYWWLWKLGLKRYSAMGA